MIWREFGLVLLLLYSVVGISYGQYFEDYTNASGLPLINCTCNSLEHGLSVADFNGDDWPDLTITSRSGDEIYFFENQMGVFNQVDLGIGDTSNVKMALWTDLDNDGDKDLLLAIHGARNKLFRCDGPNQYIDVTAFSGILNVSDKSYGIAIGDINNDGLLDILVGNYDLVHSNYLYINQDNMHFQEKSDEYNYDEPLAATFQHAIVDLNRDGLQDIYTINDRYNYQNYLYQNVSSSSLNDTSQNSGADISINAMDAGIADYNEDGFVDIYVTNTPEGNVLLENNGDFTFNDVADAIGVGFYRIGWGGTFLDVENDMDMDLHVCGSENYSGAPNALYINQFPPSYEYIEENISGDTLNSMSNAVSDFDRDGKLDLFVLNSLGIRPKVYRNISSEGNHWIKVKLEGTISNRDGTGSQLEMHIGGRMITQYVNCGESFLTQLPFIEHFGIGNSQYADSLIIYWPSGIIERLYDLEGDSMYAVVEGESIQDSVKISGQISHESGESVSSVLIDFTGDYEGSLYTNDSGMYQSHLPAGTSINIRPHKNDDWNNGISTVDLVEIQLHILGLKYLDNPYEYIAADANADNQISTLDIIICQLLNLELINSIDGNTSYRFVPSEYDFMYPEDPLIEDFPESEEVENIQEDIIVDFKAIKIGDVN